MKQHRYGIGDYVEIIAKHQQGEKGIVRELYRSGDDPSYGIHYITGEYANNPGSSVFKEEELAPHKPLYPEIEKMKDAQPESQIIGGFIEWLRENNMDICQPYGRHGDYEPCYKSTEQHLADYFGVDLQQVAREKDRVLADHQRAVAKVAA